MSRKNLFPAGLRIEPVAHSIEEIEDQSVFWGLETERLGQGRYEGRISAVHSGSVQLTRSLRSLRTLLRGNLPRDTVVLSVPVNAPRSIFYRGGLLATSSAIALRHTEEVDFRSAGFLDMLTIAVDEDRLQQHAMALWGEPLDARRKRQRSPPLGGRLVARLLQLLDVAERDSNRVANTALPRPSRGQGSTRFFVEVANGEKPDATRSATVWHAKRLISFTPTVARHSRELRQRETGGMMPEMDGSELLSCLTTCASTRT